MMGPKKLKAIRDELRAALTKTGKDPIQWLEDRIQQLERKREPGRNETELLEALARFLKGSKQRKPKPARRRTKASS